MGFLRAKDYDHKKNKSDTKRLSKNPDKNNGITSNQDFQDEKQFQKYLAQWIEGRTLQRTGYNQETKKTKQWEKKEEATAVRVEREPSRQSGFGDIAIYHDELDLSWNHRLAKPLIIECKNKKSFRHAAEQAVRYKQESSKKYREQGKYKKLDTAIATPTSLSTAEIASSHGTEHSFSTNFEAKRIYWKLGIGVMQSIQEEIILSFNEGDVVRIK